MIKIGCAGYPINQATYQDKLSVVEMNLFKDHHPKTETILRWRDQSPHHFEFITVASPKITHLPPMSKTTSYKSSAPSRIGHFQDTHHVWEAVRHTQEAARMLKSKIILFLLPANIHANPDQIGRLYNFFKKMERLNELLVWDPPKSWPSSLIDRLSKELSIFPAFNPLSDKAPPNFPINYYRLNPPFHSRSHPFTNTELKHVKRACHDRMTYVIFNNGLSAFKDAVLFSQV